MPEPVVDPWHVLVLKLTEIELARVEGRFSTEEHAVHEHSALPHRRREIVAAAHTHSRGEPPEMAPVPSKHACPHGLRSRQEAEDVLQDAVRHRFYAASAAFRRRHRIIAVSSESPMHSVEQVVGAAPTNAVEPRNEIRSDAVQSEQTREADSAGGHLTSPAAAFKL
jgi:hypothetical protein